MDNAQVNWNAVIIIYGTRDPIVRMFDKEKICLFHWIQSLDIHTKHLIIPNFQEQHKALV